MNLPKLQAAYLPGQLFRHIDGGYYQFDKSVLFADDQDELVIYQHIWPFEISTWARRYSEFKDRFTPITEEQLVEAQKTERSVVQQRIEDNRTNRRQQAQA